MNIPLLELATSQLGSNPWILPVAGIIFIVGYIAIAFEHQLGIDKSATAMLLGVVSLLLLDFQVGQSEMHHVALEILAHIAEVFFFLLPVMAIVLTLEQYHSFDVIIKRILRLDSKHIVPSLLVVTFFLSAIIDNMTTILVMLPVIFALYGGRNSSRETQKKQLYLSAMLVITANAGGVWSPIGDVTTTMLWIARAITPTGVFINTFLASVVCASTAYLLFKNEWRMLTPVSTQQVERKLRLDLLPSRVEIKILCLGLMGISLGPLLKVTLGLPPWAGVTLGWAILHTYTEYIQRKLDPAEKNALSAEKNIFPSLDFSTLFFLFGILMAVFALNSLGVLPEVVSYSEHHIVSLLPSFWAMVAICTLVGILSSVIDNVPLVAMFIAVYLSESVPEFILPATMFVTDGIFWQFLAYTVGVGGSLLIIGSVAGLAAMGLLKDLEENMTFSWYFKFCMPRMFVAYLAGCLTFIGQQFTMGTI